MARQEVYTTIVKLNSEEAKNRLKELEDKVARLKKAKQDAFSTGDSRLGASLAKDLKAAEREMKQFKNSTMSVKETLENLSSASLGQLEKAARHLKGQMKAVSDPSDYAKLEAQLDKVKESFSIEIIEAVNSYTRAGALITVDDVNYLKGNDGKR